MSLSLNMMQLFSEEISSPDVVDPRCAHGFGKKSSPSTTSIQGSTPTSGRQWKIRQISKIPSFDEDSGLGMEYDMTEEDAKMFGFGDDTTGTLCDELNGSFDPFTPPSCQEIPRARRGVKKSLFAGKRTIECEDSDEDFSPSLKKIRQGEPRLLKLALTNSPVQRPLKTTQVRTCPVQRHDTNPCLRTSPVQPSFKPDEDRVDTIIKAVDRLTTDNDLIADGSRDYSLPTIPGKHSDLKSISSETMVNLLRGKYDNVDQSEVRIVDCRFPYEYEGGHIQGAQNLYTKDAVHDLLKLPKDQRPRILIFHCEFSSERGPKMFRFLRSIDRDLNKDQYPKLHYPEIYLLEGGYKVFFAHDKTLCEPQTYKPMLHKDHTEDLRYFRLKSKSWAAGQDQQPRKSRRARSRLSLNY